MIPASHEHVERLAADIVHDEIKMTGSLTTVMHADDIGVAELAKDHHFAIEAGLVGRPGKGAFLHDFDRDFALGGLLDSLINNALSAAMDLTKDFVAGKGVCRWPCCMRYCGALRSRCSGERIT